MISRGSRRRLYALLPLAVGAIALTVWALADLSVAGPDQRAKGKNAALGAIAGTVELAGKAPERKALDRRSDPVCAKTARLDEAIVARDGKLRDVHVRIKTGTAGSHAPPSSHAVINQLECMYSPRVVGLVEGQSLAIHNGDPTYHNVRGKRGKRTIWNLGQPASGPAIVRKNIGKAGEVVGLHCDIHPWMRAYAVITDHPYFAVTGSDGSFSIANVPAGTYTLEAWHPELGLKSMQLEVAKGKTAKARFRY